MWQDDFARNNAVAKSRRAERRPAADQSAAASWTMCGPPMNGPDPRMEDRFFECF
ncbi:hypothetical protein [Streptomyces sp. NPDC048425]|uniref:hypothetical protein n=1 Tax=Streptomyces sp. NPDC048425 TaxID=3365548 RepID=UPI003716302E